VWRASRCARQYPGQRLGFLGVPGAFRGRPLVHGGDQLRSTAAEAPCDRDEAGQGGPGHRHPRPGAGNQSEVARGSPGPVQAMTDTRSAVSSFESSGDHVVRCLRSRLALLNRDRWVLATGSRGEVGSPAAARHDPGHAAMRARSRVFHSWPGESEAGVGYRSRRCGNMRHTGASAILAPRAWRAETKPDPSPLDPAHPVLCARCLRGDQSTGLGSVGLASA